MSMTIKCKVTQKVTDLKILTILAERLGWAVPQHTYEQRYRVATKREGWSHSLHFDLSTGDVLIDEDYRTELQSQVNRINGIEYNAALSINTLRERGLDYTESLSAEGYPVFEAEIKEVAYA